MNRQEILAQMNNIFTDVFDNAEIVVTDSTSANNLEEWDSLTHIQLVVTIEKRFKVKFTAQEIYVWKNVGDIINSIEAKLKTN